MAKIDINKSLSAKITQVRYPKSYQGAIIVPGEASKVVLELKGEGFSGDEIRAAIDHAAEDAKLTDPEVKLFQADIDRRFGKSMPAPASATTVVSDARYCKLINDVATALTKKDQPHPGFALPGSQTFNPKFWKRMPQPDPSLPTGTRTNRVPGTFEPTTPQTRPSAAVRDMLDNPGLYKYDCATGAIAAAYMVLVQMHSNTEFDQKFHALCIGPWTFDPQLQLILEKQGADDKNQKGNAADLKAGDIIYFNNPGVVEEYSAAWSGENATCLGPDTYYAHPLGIKKADEILAELKEKCGLDDPVLPVLKPYLISQRYRPNMSKVGKASP